MKNKNSSNYKIGEELAKEALEQWDELSDEALGQLKRGIKEKINVHHGEIGVVSVIFGELLNRVDDDIIENLSAHLTLDDIHNLGEILVGFGAHLTFDDIQDLREWFDREIPEK